MVAAFILVTSFRVNAVALLTLVGIPPHLVTPTNQRSPQMLVVFFLRRRSAGLQHPFKHIELHASHGFVLSSGEIT